jgi:NAD-dependent SIR2 family protein deacetylase
MSESENKKGCTPCEAGKYQDQKEKAMCKSCPSGKWSNKVQGTDPATTECIDCLPGKTSYSGSIACFLCGKGKYAPMYKSESCTECEKNTYSDDENTNKRTCQTCPTGYETLGTGAGACSKIPGLVQAEDCTASQYLNDTNSTIPFCASCPLGASCEGPVTWENVTAKYGWWRLHDASTRPPDCLTTETNQKSLQPTCAFQECLYPHACHGKPNPGHYKLKRTNADRSNELYDPAHELSNFTETCDETKGYKNNCTDKHGNIARCHLCATCIGVGDRRYKRKGSGTECQLCPSVSANRMWLGVGVVGMIFGTAVLIFLEITSETSIDETSDTVKKIILNFLQVSCCCCVCLFLARLNTCFYFFVRLSL